MTSKVTFVQAIKTGLVTSAVASVVNAAIFFIFHASGVLRDDIFVQPGQPLTVVPVILSSTLPTLLACIVFFLLDKITSNGFKIFRVIMIVFGLLSLAAPFTGVPGVTTGYALVLEAMHVVVIVALLYFVQKQVRSSALA